MSNGFTDGPAPPGTSLGGLGRAIANISIWITVELIARALLLVAQAVTWVGYAVDAAVSAITTTVAVVNAEVVVLGFFGQLINGLKSAVTDIISKLGSIFSGLRRLSWGRLWRIIKSLWDRFRRALRWYQRRIQAPLDRIRRTIWELYNRFFRPLLRVLEQFRVFIRLLAIFNRRLAAKLDSALFGLERKLMYPITALLKRVNELSSYTRAIITSLGLLDRVLLLESLRRDASLVWEILTNPRGRIYEPIVHPEPRPSVSQTARDIEIYAKTGAGPMAERMDALDVLFQQAQLDVLG